MCIAIWRSAVVFSLCFPCCARSSAARFYCCLDYTLWKGHLFPFICRMSFAQHMGDLHTFSHSLFKSQRAAELSLTHGDTCACPAFTSPLSTSSVLFFPSSRLSTHHQFSLQLTHLLSNILTLLVLSSPVIHPLSNPSYHSPISIPVIPQGLKSPSRPSNLPMIGQPSSVAPYFQGLG